MGSVDLDAEELKSLEEGDFVLVEDARYRPSNKKGSFQFAIGDKSIFQVKLKSGQLKILDYIYDYGEDY